MQHITISTDKSKLDVNYIHEFLATESYWAKNIPLETVIRSIDGSVCFGIYDGNRQIGFARVITDHATFAYLADVFIDKNYRGKGISKQLMAYIMDYEPLKGIRVFMLATLDAHSLYQQFGFKALKEPARYMSIKYFDSY
jgi:GNAT superfamily N-acetyltransferase